MFIRMIPIISLILMVFIAANASAELVAYYPFEEGSGNVATDVSGYGHDGTSTGLVWIDGPSGFGSAIYFDGSNPATNYVNCGTWDPSGTTDELTVALWVRWDGPVANVNQGIIAKRRTYASQAIKWQLQLDAGSPYDLHARNFEGEDVGSDDLVLPQGEWTFIALTCDSITGIIYINGVQVASSNYSMAYGDNEQIEIGCDNAGGANGWHGGIDEVQIFDTVLTANEIMTLFTGQKGLAVDPEPKNRELDVNHDTSLNWTPGQYPGTHNVYFSSDFNDVNDSIALMSEQQDVNTYDPGILEFGTTYYWRIDEVNDSADATVYRGNIWSFTTEAYSLKIPSDSIKVKASSQESKEEGPENTINESGLDPNDMDLHSEGTIYMWSTDDANSSDPAWIQYDFDKVYKLHQMLVWNYNGQSLLTGFGIKDVNIQYSEDGQNWTNLTSTTQFARAPGLAGYKYNTTVDFNGVSAKSVRINAISNWGGIWYPQYGLSEVRFRYIPVRAREPYPDDMNDVPVDVTLRWRAGREAAQHVVSYSTDEQTLIDGTADSDTVTQTSYGPLSLDLGSAYYWQVNEVGDSAIWASDILSFRTQEYIIVEDFEFYDDVEPNRVWDFWSDGWYDEDNGSTMGYPDPDFDNGEHFVETTVVRNGEQSGPLIYNNTDSVNYSEVVLVLDSAQDWTRNAADEVVMSFRGNAVEFYESDDGYIAMSAEGVDIYGTEDEFRYAYKTLQGDGSITVRVDSIQNVNVWSKAGIMIRNSLEPNDVHVTTVLGANGIAELERRTTMGGSTTTTDVANFNSPCWFRITRTGNVFTAQCSKDGVNWRFFESDPNAASTVTVDMGNTVYIGLVVTSHTADVVAAATFYNATTTGNVTGSDWTVEAIGDTEQVSMNTIDKLYIALEDSSGNRHDVYAPVITAVGWGNWYEWKIPQSEFSDNGVSMTRVKKIIVGVGDPDDPMHGSGTVFIDDIGYGHTMLDQ